MDQQSEKIYQYINPKSQTFFPIFGKGGGQTSKHSLLCLLCKCIELGDFYVMEGQLI